MHEPPVREGETINLDPGTQPTFCEFFPTLKKTTLLTASIAHHDARKVRCECDHNHIFALFISSSSSVRMFTALDISMSSTKTTALLPSPTALSLTLLLTLRVRGGRSYPGLVEMIGPDGSSHISPTSWWKWSRVTAPGKAPA